MHSLRVWIAMSVGLILSQSGCYHYAYSPYGNNGMGAYPGYGQGTYPMAPGDGYIGSPSPTYTPAGPGYSPNSPTYAPNGSGTLGPGPTPLNNPPSNQPPRGGGGSAPTFGNPGTGQDKTVPKPANDDSEKSLFGDPPAASNAPLNSGGLSNSGIQLQPIESAPNSPTGATNPAGTLASTADPFETPIKSTASRSNVMAKSASLGSSDSRPNPFAHDARGYTWLRGIVDYDSDDQRWLIIYSANPDQQDKYGGSITLGDHQLFSHIKPGDVVLVEGEVAENSYDRHGKPIYQINKLQPLKPKH